MTRPLKDNELGVFLRSRRQRISPAEAGLPAGNGVRRTPGLRREEVATLAGVSIDYYARLERGRERRPSMAVLDALAGVFGLDNAEWQHLHALAAHATGNGTSRPAVPRSCVRETSLLLLEAVRPSPAAHLRSIAGQNPDAPDITRLVEGLLPDSPDFARFWSRYDVKPRTAGYKRFQHPKVGRMTLSYESLPLAGADGQRLIVYLAAPGTADHDAMVLLDMLATGQETDARPL